MSDHGTMGGSDAGILWLPVGTVLKLEALRSMSVELSNIVVGDIPFYRLVTTIYRVQQLDMLLAVVSEVWCLFRDSRVWQVSASCPVCFLHLHEAGFISACARIS